MPSPLNHERMCNRQDRTCPSKHKRSSRQSMSPSSPRSSIGVTHPERPTSAVWLTASFCLFLGTIYCTTGSRCSPTVQSQPRCMKTLLWLKTTHWWILWSECCRLYRISTSPWRLRLSKASVSRPLAIWTWPRTLLGTTKSLFNLFLCVKRLEQRRFLAYIKATVTFIIYEVQWAFQNVLFFILNNVAVRC